MFYTNILRGHERKKENFYVYTISVYIINTFYNKKLQIICPSIFYNTKTG